MYNLYNLNKQGDNMDNHKKKLSIKDIAAISGVSIATVSRVLNNKGGYSKETEEKINALAKSYGYVSNMNAKSLRESKSQTIGLIVPDISNDFFATLALHIENYSAKHNYSVFICNSANNVQKEKDYFKSLASKCVDGIICISGLNKLTEDIIYNDIPIVCIDRYPENNKTIPRISSDDIHAAFLATEHLIKKGCRDIVFISSFTADYEKKERYLGYKKALDTYGIPLDKNYILQTQGKEPSQIEAEILITDFLKTQRRIDGIFASSDLAALGALYALKRANHKVPEQVKLIGFDNTLYSRLPTPSISTIERNPKMLAEKGCEVLLNMIQGKDIGSIDTIVPVVLVERESSK